MDASRSITKLGCFSADWRRNTRDGVIPSEAFFFAEREISSVQCSGKRDPSARW